MDHDLIGYFFFFILKKSGIQVTLLWDLGNTNLGNQKLVLPEAPEPCQQPLLSLPCPGTASCD